MDIDVNGTVVIAAELERMGE